MTPIAAVRARGLVKHFDGTKALDGVTFDVENGELFGLIGPDGAGKTTLFRILCGLLVPGQGRAEVLGLDAVREFRKTRPRIGYMPGRASVYPDLSVEENLHFFASAFGTSPGEGRDLVAPIYSRIEPYRDRRAADLSGGMRQKLALSCALIHRPELLLLDEPTTGVDAVSRREFWDLLSELAHGGLTVIVSTPYMDEAGRCDRVALLQRGRVLGADEPAAIGAGYERPLLAVRNHDRYRLLRRLRRYRHTAAVYPFGKELHFTDARVDRDPEDVADDLRRWLGEEGFDDARVRTIAAGIEDVFMALMEER